MDHVWIDKATIFAWSNAVENFNTEANVDILWSIITTFGFPQKIRCDNDSHFRNQTIQDNVFQIRYKIRFYIQQVTEWYNKTSSI